jgi:hypothetical protein
MMSQDFSRHGWRCAWLNLLFELSDLDVQRKRWFSNRNLVDASSYAELRYLYFEHFELFEGYSDKIKSGVVSNDEAKILEKMHKEFSEHRSSYSGGSDIDVLTDPNWQKVVFSAQEARKSLLLLLDDPDEVSALTIGNWSNRG